MKLPIKGFKSGREYKMLLDEKFLTRTQAMLAQCYHCMGVYDGGPCDCRSKACPMYYYMPYREQNDIPQPSQASQKHRQRLSELAKINFNRKKVSEAG